MIFNDLIAIIVIKAIEIVKNFELFVLTITFEVNIKN
jgi:hypothetical protein